MRPMDGDGGARRRVFWPGFGVGAGTVVVIFVVIALIAYWFFIRSTSAAAVTERPADPYPSAEHRIAALGDSFASGEGAQAFWKASNNCHRTWASYAYTIAVDYHEGLTFPACSGA